MMSLNRYWIASAAAALLAWAGLSAQAPGQCTGYDMLIEHSSSGFTGSFDIGNHGDDVLTIVPLPFPVTIYGQAFTIAVVCSNGQMTMGLAGTNAYLNTCLPSAAFPNVALMPFWDDLRTDGPGQGIFTETSGAAPHRTFYIEWRAGYYSGFIGTADFAVIFFEGTQNFAFGYNNINDGAGIIQSEGATATVGLQPSGSGPAVSVGCNAAVLDNGEYILFQCATYVPLSCSLSLPQTGGPAGTGFDVFCTVTPGHGPASTGLSVSLDASAIGGGTVALHDDGVGADEYPGDHIFSGTVFAAPGTAAGTYTLTSMVSDAQGRTSTSAASYSVRPPLLPCRAYAVTASFPNVFEHAFPDTGNHGDDVTTTVVLPFPVRLFAQNFTQATVCSNGQMTMGPSGNAAWINNCLPSTIFPGVTLMPFWDDLRTDGPGQGIFVAPLGTAPNRSCLINWIAGLFGRPGTVDFGVIFYEGQSYFDFIYNDVNADSGTSATIGVQSASGGPFTQFSCNAGGFIGGERLRFSCTNIILPPPPPFGPDSSCCRADFDGDGEIGTDADIQAFFACLGGGCCETCPPNADFDCDGDAGTDADIAAFFRVLGGGSC